MRHAYYPKSFAKLLLGGFVLVALPLVFALVNSAISVDRLAERSQKAVYEAALATQASQRLIEVLTTLERGARQVAIVADRAWLDVYALNRAELQKVAAALERFVSDDGGRMELEDIVTGEQRIFATLSDAKARPANLRAAVEGFTPLSERARAIATRSHAVIEREVQGLRETAAAAQRIMYWQMAALVPLVLTLVGGATILISRPIGEIDGAIRRLGRGELDEPVVVSGPRDLEYLGERLDGMRCQLADLQEQKERFLREVAHALKTPLAAVREAAELLNEGAVGRLSDGQHEVIAILRHKSVELQSLIERLLDYGVLTFGGARAVRKATRIRQVVDRVAEDQRLALQAKRLVLDVQCPEFAAEMDTDKVRDILDNLVSNAIRFSPEGGTIRVVARRAQDTVVIEVIDQGPGIAPEDRAHVFEPFYRGRASGEGRIRSSGLGLSIVQQYAQAHDGKAEVVVTPDIAGAHFRVTLAAQGG